MQGMSLLPVLVLGGVGAVAVAAIVFFAARAIVQARAMERNRREIAASVAEGAVTPEEGERLIEAGRRGEGGG